MRKLFWNGWERTTHPAGISDGHLDERLLPDEKEHMILTKEEYDELMSKISKLESPKESGSND